MILAIQGPLRIRMNFSYPPHFFVLSLLTHTNGHMNKKYYSINFLVQENIAFLKIVVVLEALDYKERQYSVMETTLE